MKSNQLRIGNKVQDNNGFVFDVVSVFKDGTVYCDFEGNEGDVWEFDNNNPCQGIELTEEILLKCGFYKKQDYINGVGLCIFFEHKEFNYRLNQSFEVVLLKIKLNNLHQLQNIYWCLTNEELTVKL